MIESKSIGRRSFLLANHIFLAILAFLCLFPLIHVLAVSLSSSVAASAGKVTLWPVGWNLSAYKFVLNKEAFLLSFGVSVKRVLLGTVLNMLMVLITAYPLSKEAAIFKWRTFYAWYFLVTILFSGGLIPAYMTVKMTGLIDSIWALILPGIVPVTSVILMLNFFRGLPKELEESAYIDGAGPFRTLWSIYIPLSAPAIATLTLFSMVGHWNSWFDGIIYMNLPEHYPLQSYLRTVLIDKTLTAASAAEAELMKILSNRTINAAQIFLGALPILMVYPFLQKFFIKGIVVGSVKE
ncbi:carbohydrate ABC transporter permease [Paenibacillus eucommiae]|uniref:Aldouronate transport system permease protein n=1 Tax=Paenibacillus eucommiae TaxID=1355755 RepID=A0ABS4ISX2_9BACL|nr:carbohydrate ABC transporter permease [Paenibacillus eucommiae]MBP1990675.1 putative aldouronate transport system permease protein [Paenibacillus eucommiae]